MIDGVTGIQKLIMAKKMMKMEKEIQEAKMEAQMIKMALKGKKK